MEQIKSYATTTNNFSDKTTTIFHFAFFLRLQENILSLSLISENQNIIIDKTKLEKRNVIIDYSLLSIQF